MPITQSSISRKRVRAERHCWYKMRQRCLNPNDQNYYRYGGRGIRICSGWSTYAGFYRDLGDKPSAQHSIDRIDNDGHYSCGKCDECILNGWPFNCRWATPYQQSNNTRANVRITRDGKTLTITEWAKEMDVNPSTLNARSARGLSPEEIIAPVKKLKPRVGYKWTYSRLAINFQSSLQVGDKFTPIKDHAPHYGQILTVDGLVRQYKNPDDCLYWLKDEQGQLLEPIRCWWLRKCCTKVELSEVMPKVQDREAIAK